MLYLTAVVLAIAHLSAAVPTFNDAIRVSSLQSAALDEISGLAASRIHDGILYGINDHTSSTVENKVYAIDANTGVLKATLTIRGATNWDWEDIAVGPCPDSGSCIYIGDIGSHNGISQNTVYRVREPATLEDKAIAYLDKLQYRWGEPESECLMVDPAGNAFIVSRVQGGQGLMAKLPSFGWGGQPADLTVTSRLSTSTAHYDPLGCDISLDGKAMLIKARDDIYYYSVPDGDYVGAATGKATTVTYDQKEIFGESVAWTTKGDGYYTVGEGLYKPIYLYSAVGTVVVG
ncbi:uncharacterized protein LOC124115445 [Haliotis rufescens]|uniref:uncharacterized protein LOC124115445 n=1 Tax=Haliotis rufescens TaxID=6454 RepID=UPI00201EB528|nr:uncharacterized protein LOC124115445 [Haliotis rufescens]